jgi:hypothetical protein
VLKVIPEPHNEHDKNALAVYASDMDSFPPPERKLGYIPAKMTSKYAKVKEKYDHEYSDGTLYITQVLRDGQGSVERVNFDLGWIAKQRIKDDAIA